MPQVIPAVVGFLKVAVVAVKAWAGAHPLLWAGAKVAGSLLLSSALTPKRPKLGSTGTQLAFKADLTAGLPVAVGRTALGGNIIHQYPSGEKNKYMSFIVALCCAGPVHGNIDFYANRTETTFNASTGAVTNSPPWASKMWQKQVLGDSPESSPIAMPTAPAADGGSLSHWTSAHKASGIAKAWWVLEYDQEAYATGVPQPMWVGDWVKCYDPRLDSTYPGGSGSHRSDDATTWAWTQNPYIIALQFCLGWFQNGKRVAGAGVDIDMIDVSQFVDGANVADYNGWTCGGAFTTRDSKWQVLTAILQSGGGRPSMTGAKIGCVVNAPRTSLATLTEADVYGAVQAKTAKSKRERINSITPRYRSEDHDWQVVAAEPVTVTDYVTADGELRSREIEYPFVQDVDQVAQLAAYDILNGREIDPITVPAGPAWAEYNPGDCITLDLPQSGLNSQKAIITGRSIDPATGGVRLTLISETDAKHDFCLGRTGTPPALPGLTAPDFGTVPAPGSSAWTAEAVETTSGGVTVFSILVEGAVDNAFATEVIVEYRVDGATDWEVAALLSPRATRHVITGLVGLTAYEVAISYRTFYGVVGSRLVLDTVFTTNVPGDIVFTGVSDGDTLDFGQVLSNLPEVIIDASDCIPPASGEARANSVTALSTTSATVAIKNTTPSGTTTETATASLVSSEWVAEKPTTDDASNNIYRFQGTLSPARPNPAAPYYAIMVCYYRKSGDPAGTWTQAGNVGGVQPSSSSVTLTLDCQIIDPIGQDGDPEFKIYAALGTVTGGQVSYDVLSTGGTYSATDTYRKARVTIRPRTA